MAHSVRRHLRLEIDQYDESIRRFIPGYDVMLSVAAGHVAAVLPDVVLDLGAGTGALSQAILERAGVGRVLLMDVDPEMLDQARDRLRGYGERALFVLRSFDDPLPECDAIAASLSLHHLPTIEAKAALFGRAFEALRPGGVFVNADATMPADEVEREELYRFWVDHMVRGGITPERAREHLAEWAEEDTYLPLEAELAALGAVGFDARSVWRAGPIGVVVGRRPLG
jgi:tRNA (cmo5U34)-methyltransferase